MIRPALALVATLTLALASCGNPPPPPKTPRAVTPPRPVDPITPRATTPRATTPPKAPAKPKIPARLRCQSNDDCEISTFTGCCRCCACGAKPYAINKLVSQANRNRCNAVDCAPCAKKCAPCPTIIGGTPGRAECIKNRCTRVVDNKSGKRPMGAFEGYE
jgi:hypothetical protein